MGNGGSIPKGFGRAARAVLAKGVGPPSAGNETEQAVFAAGCFWGVELAFQRVPGVVETAVGYTAGKTQRPTRVRRRRKSPARGDARFGFHVCIVAAAPRPWRRGRGDAAAARRI